MTLAKIVQDQLFFNLDECNPGSPHAGLDPFFIRARRIDDIYHIGIHNQIYNMRDRQLLILSNKYYNYTKL